MLPPTSTHERRPRQWSQNLQQGHQQPPPPLVPATTGYTASVTVEEEKLNRKHYAGQSPMALVTSNPSSSDFSTPSSSIYLIAFEPSEMPIPYIHGPSDGVAVVVPQI